MKNILTKAVIFLLVPAHLEAGSVMGTGGSLEVTQILHVSQAASHAIEQIQHLSSMISTMENQMKQLERNTENLKDFRWGNARQHLMELDNAVRQGQALAYSLNSIEADYRQKFKDYDHYRNKKYGQKPEHFHDKYNKWSQTNLDTIRSTMKAANLQSKQFHGEDDTIRTLESMSQTSSGRMQAIQVGNQLAAHQVRQMQKLRQIMLSQIQMQSAYMASKVDKESMNKANTSRFFESRSNVILGNGERF